MNKNDVIKERQSKASKEGKNKEKEVINLLLEDGVIKNNFLIGKPSKVLTPIV